MKLKLLTLFLSLFLTLGGFAQYQTTIGVANKHYHDLNIEPMNDGSDDMIVAGNLFDSTLQNEELTLKRVDQNGVVIWIKKFTHMSLVHARSFDIVIVADMIFVTGSIDVNGVRKVFIAKILATNGTFMSANYYDIVSPNFNSRGLKIVHTLSDANGNGTSDPGFAVAGFFSDCYAVDINCTFNNIGFVMRTDINLNLIWTTEIDAPNTTNTLEYDFANDVTETSDGFFITGSATGLSGAGNIQQAVLAHKIDFQGVMVWDNSYIFGNANDVSTDAYYDTTSNEIYMLVNYSISHYFGVTVLNNGTGVINPAKSWYAGGPDLDRYGFRIMESVTSGNNLVISGYDRDENWTTQGVGFFGQSNIFVYEFVKATGVQVASYQFLVPHVEPTGDEFNFWSGQLPLIYYPDISYFYIDEPGNPNYYHVGYRTNPSATFTETELVKTPTGLQNECINLALQLNPNAAGAFQVPVTSGQVPNTLTPLVLNDMVIPFNTSACDPTLSTGDDVKDKGSIYPNPASDYIYFTAGDVAAYAVLDSSGRMISQGTVNSEKSVYVGNLTNGMYFIQAYDTNQNMQTYKLIKK